MSTHRMIARSAGTIGALTSVSRVLGFVRDLVIAAAFGTGLHAEAFVVSFKIPNLFRDLVGEGAANAAFVPVLTEYREKRPAEFWRLVSTLFAFMAAVLAVLSVGGVLLAPQIVHLIAPGFGAGPADAKFELAVRLTRVIFPYLFLIGLSALAMGVLNSMKEFASSAAGPILLNLSMIAAGVFFEERYGPMALVVGVLAGGVLQLSFQLPPLVRSGLRLERPQWRHPAARQIGTLLIPRALGSAVYQINVFVDTVLASFERIVGPGGQSALYYSNRLFQLPLAVFGVSLAQALLPAFSAQWVRLEKEKFNETFGFATRALTVAVLPASVGLVALSRPIVRIIFERGEFNAYSTAITSSALFFYAFGLLFCCLVKVFANAFYAMQDTRTPVKAMAIAVTVNVALSLALMRPLQIGGLALASTLSAGLNLLLLYRALKKKIGPLDERRWFSTLGRALTAAVLMGLAAKVYEYFLLTPLAGSGAAEIIALLGGIALCMLLYFFLAVVLRVEEAKRLLNWALSR